MPGHFDPIVCAYDSVVYVCLHLIILISTLIELAAYIYIYIYIYILNKNSLFNVARNKFFDMGQIDLAFVYRAAIEIFVIRGLMKNTGN